MNRRLLGLLPDYLRVTARREWQIALLTLVGLGPGVAVLTAWLNLAWLLQQAPDAGERHVGWLLPAFLLEPLGVAGVLVGTGVVTLLIGCLGLANAYLLSVERRMPEFALLQGLGLRRRDVTALLLTESAVAGLVGVVTGVLGGVLLARASWTAAQSYFDVAGPYHLAPAALTAAGVTGFVAAMLFMGTSAAAEVTVAPMRLLRGERPLSPLRRWGERETSFYGAVYAAILALIGGAFVLPGRALGALVVLTLTLSVVLTVGGWLLARLYPRLPAPDRSILWRMALQGLARHPRHTAGLSLAMIAGAYGAGLAGLAVVAGPRPPLFPVWVAGGVLVAGAGLVLTAASLAALERRREYGLLVALGARPSRVRRMILLEYGIVALGGGGVGALLALFNWALAGAGDWLIAVTVVFCDLLAALASAGVGALPVLWRMARRAPGAALREE
ncbi:MAG: ABC transporter permease [Caldilineae bacterium]|nr:MAG: ABC transporter permease [Caldilineae bacterium]